MTMLAFSRAPVPLPEGMDQTGYIARFGGALATRDKPEMKILLLKEPMGEEHILIFCDLLGFSPARTKLLEKRLAARFSLSPENILITCTHTHSAPASMSLLLLGECRDSWFYAFEHALFDAVQTAREEGYAPARFSFGKTEVEGVARNRVKQNLTDIDPDETVLYLETKKRRIALVNFSCHPVTKNADNRRYSRDYPGIVADTLIENGAADEVIFATAPCGDINPVLQDEPGKDDRMLEYGRAIAKSVSSLISSGALMETEGFSMEKRTLSLPLMPDHDRADLSSLARRSRINHQNAADPVKKKYEEANYLYARSHERLKELGLSETAFPVTVSILKFGALTVFCVPFELFSGIGVHLKQAAFPACVWELSGGDFGYFPSDDLWEEAAYERADAYMYYNRGGPLPKGSEGKLLEELLR